MTITTKPNKPHRVGAGRAAGNAGRAVGNIAVIICVPTLLFIGAVLGVSGEPLLRGTGIALIGVVIGLTVLVTGRNEIDPLGPGAFIAYSHVLLFLLRPLYCFLYQDGINLFTQQPFNDSVVPAQVIAALGFISITISLRLSNRRASSASLRFSRDHDGPVMPMAWLVFAAEGER